MNESKDIEALRARLEGTRGRELLAQSRSGCRNAGIQGVPAPRVSAERVGMARPGRPPRLPEADERVARARRRQRLHAPAERGARSLRPTARGDRSRQAAVLRDRDDDERRRHGAARRESRGPPDEDRRQPRSSVEPRRHRPVRAGRRSSVCTTRIDRRRSPTSATSVRSAPLSSAAKEMLAAQKQSGGRGFRILTETVASPTLAAQIRAAARQRCRRRSGCSGSLSAVTTRAKAAGWRSASTSRRSTRSTRPTSSCRSTPTSCAPVQRASVTPARSRRVAGSKAIARRRIVSTPSRARRPTPAPRPIIGCRCAPSQIEAFARAVASRLGVGGAAAAELPEAATQVDRSARQGSAGARAAAAW